jgi:hypothetical protein
LARELVITEVPGRSGLYLGVTEGNQFKSIARFTHGRASAEFLVEVLQSVGMVFVDDRKKEEEVGTREVR